MKNIFKVLILIFFLLSCAGEIPATPGSPYIRYWLICGPFEKVGLDTSCIENEAEISPVADEISSGKCWRTYLSCEDKISFNLEEVFGPYENSVAYAFTEVYSPTVRRVKLFLGSDDGVKVWLNGENIFAYRDERGLVFDEDKIEVGLNAGWNRLLIKVNNVTGDWALSARFIKYGGAEAKDLTYRPMMLYQLPVKKVEVSSTQPTPLEDKGIFDATMAIDKSRYTRWSSEWSDPQWIILDLGKPKPIKKILLNWEAYAKKYSVEISNNKESWKAVYSTDIGDGGQDVINFRQPAEARYIKVAGTERGTRFGYSLWEFQVFSEEPE